MSENLKPEEPEAAKPDDKVRRAPQKPDPTKRFARPGVEKRK